MDYFPLFRLLIIIIGSVACQNMEVNVTGTGICKGDIYRNVHDLKKHLNNCVVIVGSLEISIWNGRPSDFYNTQFYNLREITEYLVIYGVKGLESVGQLFPSLTRIRGNKLFFNYGLIVYDNQNLLEVGLYSLLKIDRGGIIMWGSPPPCFVDTINWETLAPNSRHVISSSQRQIACRVRCTCSTERSKNFCWSNKKCQLFQGDDKCHEQCLGCRITKKNVCFVCQHYTYQYKCVTKCPDDTIILTDNKYCITKQQCQDIGHLVWNNTCVSECPVDFKINNKTGNPVCEPCAHCQMNCSSLVINSLSAIQHAEKCVNINGSLVIHLRALQDAMRDLRKYLGRIEQVTDYIAIEASDVITSLDFLSSLREIKGNKLKNNKYSLYVHHNINLQTLFAWNVTKNLVIRKGTAHFERNIVLCMNLIEDVKKRLPVPPVELDIPAGSNGYSGDCGEMDKFNFSVKIISDTSVEVSFSRYDNNIYYTALYARILPDTNTSVSPQFCSGFEWHTADLMVSGKNTSLAELKDLHPASPYVFCVEIYNPEKNLLTRSNIINFSTPVGIPEPPFILELVADKSDVIVIRWVNHRYYEPHIKYYELDVTLIEIISRESVIDHCKYTDDFFDADNIHALVMRPPPEYNKGCESMCGTLSTVTPGALVEEHFDVCEGVDFTCDNNQESIIMENSTVDGRVRTLVLNISQGIKNEFQVGGLAPFSDYKFRLRACAAGQCSRSARGVVRTFRDVNADIISTTSVYAQSSGVIVVEWEPPKLSNGPILTYFVDVLPKVQISELMPQTWCISPRLTKTAVKSVIASKYLVRVCVKTLASLKSCSEWVKVKVTDSPPVQEPVTSKMDLLWTGAIYGVLIYILSIAFGCLYYRRLSNNDMTPLVDLTSLDAVESEPPALILSELGTFHTISLE